METGEEVGLEVGSRGVSRPYMYIYRTSQDSMYALEAALAGGQSRDAFKLTRKSLIPKKAMNLQTIRISEHVSFILNLPHGGRFAGKVPQVPYSYSEARAIKSALEIKDGISQRNMNSET